jgi:hypothetical protein
LVEDLVGVPGDQPRELVNRAYEVGASAIAAAAPPATVSRRGTILALGIIQIVLGSLCGIGALFGAFAARTTGGGVILMAAIYSLPAANLLITGIGSVKVARWARRATVISAGIWLGLGAVVTTGMLIMIFTGRFGVSRGEGRMLGVAATPLLLIWLALPIVLIVLYTRPAVRATFERRAD